MKNKVEKVLIKCICKGCNNKVLVSLKTMDAKDSAIQFFNMCPKHKKQFNSKMKEIKETKDIKKTIIKNIADNIKEKGIKNND